MSPILEGIIWGLTIAAAILFLITIMLLILYVFMPLVNREHFYIAMAPMYLLISSRLT